MKTYHHSTSLGFVLALALAVAFGATGCTQVQVSPESQGEYRLGELQVFADEDFETVYEAVKRGFKDAGVFQTQDDKKEIEADLRARDQTDAMIVVKLKQVGRERTSVKIRYGIPGNLAQAQKLYQQIEKHL